MMEILTSLLTLFAELSLLAFGGGNTILPEMQRRVVEVHHWMSAEEFSALFALSQAAPGPNLMIVTVIGWHVASLAGALVATVGMFLPPSVLAVGVLHAWEHFKDRPWRAAVQTGLVPMVVGLVATSAALIARSADLDWKLAAITAGCAAMAFKTKIHPVCLLLGGGVIGMLAELI
ncbi:MAG: chromate transporter [Candidatus Protistobacter heckmanni]|nr:chromate transporter [Candidatus Protistobacter heckmanni]